MKNKKRVIIDVVVAVVMIVFIVTTALLVNKFDSDNAKKQSEVITNQQGETQVITGTPKERESIKKAEAEKQKKGWDGVEVEEATDAKEDESVLYKVNKKGEVVTNKKGEPVTRSANYPGEEGGWSPIVTPDDLKKNK